VFSHLVRLTCEEARCTSILFFWQ